MAKSWKSFLPPDPPAIGGEDAAFGGQNALPPAVDETLQGLFAERDQLAQQMQGLISPQADSSQWPEILSIPEKRKADQQWAKGRKLIADKLRAKRKETIEKPRKKLSEIWLSKREKWLESYQRQQSERKEWESRQAKILENYKKAKKEAEKLQSFRKQLDDFQQRAAEMGGGELGEPSFLSDQKFLPDELDKRLNAAREKYSAKAKYVEEAAKVLSPGGLQSFVEKRGKQLADGLANRLAALGNSRKAEQASAQKASEKKVASADDRKITSLFNRREERKQEANREERKQERLENRRAERKARKAEQDQSDQAEQAKDEAKREERKRQRLLDLAAMNSSPQPPLENDTENAQKKREGTLKERLAARREDRKAQKQAEGKQEKKKLNLHLNRKNKR